MDDAYSRDAKRTLHLSDIKCFQVYDMLCFCSPRLVLGTFASSLLHPDFVWEMGCVCSGAHMVPLAP